MGPGQAGNHRRHSGELVPVSRKPQGIRNHYVVPALLDYRWGFSRMVDRRSPGCLQRVAAGVAILAVTAAADALAAENRVSFNRDIRPILSDNCFQCHGPDENKRQAGLRLDLRAAATKALDSGDVAIVAGKPDASELVRRIDSTDAAEQMPPASSGKKLTPRQIELLKQWISEGAE